MQHLGAEPRPLSLVLDTQHDGPAAACLEGPVRVNGRVGGAHGPGARLPLVAVVEREAHPLDHGLEHGDVDPAARLGPRLRLISPHQRPHDVGQGVHARRDVGDGDADFGGRLAVRARRRRQEAGLALYQQVERQALFGPVRPDEVRGQVGPDTGVVGAREVARSRTLDLDDAGAEVGELAGAEGGGDGLF